MPTQQSNINYRHLSEIEFHDKKARSRSNSNYYNQGALIEAFGKMLRVCGDFTNKQILDYGCGQGWAGVKYHQLGGNVIGIDISMASLNNSQKIAEKNGLKDKISYVQGTCEFLPFKEQFDLVIGIAILHHLELSLVIKSLKGVLKQQGRAVFMEPLIHNPLIQLFRKLTPNRRTKDEKPLSIDFINSLGKDFSGVSIYGYDFLALFAYAFIPFKQYELFRSVHMSMSKLDTWLFKRYPKLQKYCWGVIIEISK